MQDEREDLFRQASLVAFPGDFLYRISTDLATGSAGIALLIHRMLTGSRNFLLMLDELLPENRDQTPRSSQLTLTDSSVKVP